MAVPRTTFPPPPTGVTLPPKGGTSSTGEKELEKDSQSRNYSGKGKTYGQPFSANGVGVMLTGYTDPNGLADPILYSDNNNYKTTSKKRQYYNYFEDYSGKQFIHLLDYYIEQSGKIGLERNMDVPNKDIYFGSFIRTLDDNEDPTILGYDLTIKWDESPLLNGSLEKFITTFSGLGNSEIGSRLSLINNFKDQLFKFIKTNSPERSKVEFYGVSGAKTYYLKDLAGLNKLVESSDGKDGSSFVKYGEDFITLKFNEDVTQNIGYLASLYKSLAWSRINGKQIIPENLLRFDIDITITEIKKYNRIFKENDRLEFYVDDISKYTYTLYECQFFFPTLPHGDSLDMSNPKTVEDYEVKFNYKFSTMKFSRLYDIDITDPKKKWEYAIDNKYSNMDKINSNSTDKNKIEDGTIKSYANSYQLFKIKDIDIATNKSTDPSKKTGVVEDAKDEDGSKEKTKTPPNEESEDMPKKRPNLKEISARLLNKTIGALRFKLGIQRGIDPPRNVYTKDRIINFVGQSIKSLFGRDNTGGGRRR
jgi:hypothetical protein